MNKWIQLGMLGLALTSASVTASAEKKSQLANSNDEFKTSHSLGHHNIDAQDYAGGSKLKDRSIDATGLSVEFATVETLDS